MEGIEIVERIVKIINLFNPYRLGNVVIAVIILAVLFLLALKAIYTTSIEELFMSKKKKVIKDFFALMFFLLIFTLLNIILLIFPELLKIEYLFFGISSGYCFYCFCRSKFQCVLSNKKKIDYNERCNSFMIYAIIFMMPLLISMMKKEVDKMPLINCVLIISVIEIFLVYFSVPNLLKKKSQNYFMDNEQEIYIYKKIDGESVLCGDNPIMNKSEKYIIITYDELKKKEIYHKM